MVDQQRGRPLLENINATTIEEIQVMIGAYSAEYGNGRAGAIIVTTRDAFQMSRPDQNYWTSVHAIYTPGHLTWFETPGPEPDGDSLAASGCVYGIRSEQPRMAHPRHGTRAGLDPILLPYRLAVEKVHTVVVEQCPVQLAPLLSRGSPAAMDVSTPGWRR